MADMNVEGLRVTTVDMDETGSNVGTFASRYNSALEDLKNEVAALMQVWIREEDERADAFATSYETRNEDFVDLYELLVELSKALSEGAQTYAQGQKAIRTEIDSMFDYRKMG